MNFVGLGREPLINISGALLVFLELEQHMKMIQNMDTASKKAIGSRNALYVIAITSCVIDVETTISMTMHRQVIIIGNET